MTDHKDQPDNPSRRRFLSGTGGLIAAAAAGGAIGMGVCPYARQAMMGKEALSITGGSTATEPVLGAHQPGITTSPQRYTYFAAFDLVTEKRDEVIALLKAWSAASLRMSTGQTATPLQQNLDAPGADTAEALGLEPSRLTLTFGFGAGLFSKDGKDRYGLSARRPQALVDMPIFNGDQLQPERTGGDVSVQACADDPQVAFHAVRQLARLAGETAHIRWVQTGFISKPADNSTPRNLLGFKDGTESPAAKRHKQDNPEASKHGKKKGFDEVVWVGEEGPAWMQGGTYLVARRIRMALEHWDNTDVSFQEQVIGRHKLSGAPLGKKGEFDALDLDRSDTDGNAIIPDNAHVRLASADSNDGAQMLRRGYNYNDGANLTAERWPPWRQGLEYDAGLLFLAYQRDPREGFIKVFENMSKLDALNQFVTHTGGGLFAIPAGMKEGEFIGQKLFMSL